MLLSPRTIKVEQDVYLFIYFYQKGIARCWLHIFRFPLIIPYNHFIYLHLKTLKALNGIN